jgi:hypothetical protein
MSYKDPGFSFETAFFIGGLIVAAVIITLSKILN